MKWMNRSVVVTTQVFSGFPKENMMPYIEINYEFLLFKNFKLLDIECYNYFTTELNQSVN